jgi:hypothetical protein
MVRSLVSTLFRSFLRQALRTGAPSVDNSQADRLKPQVADLVVITVWKEISASIVDSLKSGTSTQAAGFSVHKGRLAKKNVALAHVYQTGDVGRVTEAMIVAHRPKLVAAIDFGVAFDQRLAIEDLVVANRIVDVRRHVNRIEIGRPPVARSHVGTLISIPELPMYPDTQFTSGIANGALAADRIAHEVAEVCRREGAPMLAAVAVTHNIAAETPPDVRHFDRQQSLAGRVGAIAGSLFRRPSITKQLWHRQQVKWQASQRLVEFLESVLRT